MRGSSFLRRISRPVGRACRIACLAVVLAGASARPADAVEPATMVAIANALSMLVSLLDSGADPTGLAVQQNRDALIQLHRRLDDYDKAFNLLAEKLDNLPNLISSIVDDSMEKAQRKELMAAISVLKEDFNAIVEGEKIGLPPEQSVLSSPDLAFHELRQKARTVMNHGDLALPYLVAAMVTEFSVMFANRDLYDGYEVDLRVREAAYRDEFRDMLNPHLPNSLISMTLRTGMKIAKELEFLDMELRAVDENSRIVAGHLSSRRPSSSQVCYIGEDDEARFQMFEKTLREMDRNSATSSTRYYKIDDVRGLLMRLLEVHKSGSDDLFRPFMWRDRMFPKLEGFFQREGESGWVTSVARHSYFQLHQKLFDMYLYMTQYAAYVYGELGGDLSRFTLTYDGVTGTVDMRSWLRMRVEDLCARTRIWGCQGYRYTVNPACRGHDLPAVGPLCRLSSMIIDTGRRPILGQEKIFVDAYSRIVSSIEDSIDLAKNLGHTGRVCLWRDADFCEGVIFTTEPVPPGFYCNRWINNRDRWCRHWGACP